MHSFPRPPRIDYHSRVSSPVSRALLLCASTVSRHVQLYMSPADSVASAVKEEDRAHFELDEKTPPTNVGIPIVVVACKVRIHVLWAALNPFAVECFRR